MGNQSIQLKDDGTIGMIVGMDIYPLTQNFPKILITEFADDTLYSLKNGELLPIMIKNPSAHKMVRPMMVAIDLFTDRYVFINAIEKEYKEIPKSIYIAYDRQLDDFYQPNLLNKEDNSPFAIPLKGNIPLPHNTGIDYIRANRLVKKYKSGKLQGRLKQIASKLKEDDNPVLILIKFKE